MHLGIENRLAQLQRYADNRIVPTPSEPCPACEEADVDWPIDAADLRESLLEAEADRVAGRTFSADEIRARYGLPPSSSR